MSFSNDAKSPENINLKDGQVLVKNKAAAINPIDYKLPSIPVVGWRLNGQPVSQDFSGVVVESKSKKFKKGDKVFGNAWNSMAELVIAADDSIATKPDSITFIEAASIPTVCLTSYQALLAGQTKQASNVLVVGASGGCGLVGIQIARKLVGTEGKVIGICSGKNAELVHSLGVVDFLVDYTQPDTVVGNDSLLHRTGKLTCIYDTVSSPDGADSLNGIPYDQALQKYFEKGTTTYCAINGTVSRWLRAFTGLQASGYKLIMKKRSGSQLEEIATWAQNKELKPVLAGVYDFNSQGCAEAFELLKSRRAKGKIVVNINRGDEL